MAWRGKALRLSLAAAFLFAGFFALGLSDPRLSLITGGEAKWSLRGRFQVHSAPYVLTLATGRPGLHSKLRARFNVCPMELLPHCSPDRFMTVTLDPGGARSFRFPLSKGTAEVEAFREPFHPLYLLFLACLLAAAWLAFGNALERGLAALVLFVSGPYVALTGGYLRTLDLEGHIEHMELMATEGLFVPAMSCWECYQPPLYYLAGALSLGFPQKILPEGLLLLQGASFLLQLLSVPFVVAALRPWCRDTRRLFLASALVLLWPAAVLMAGRVGNDAPQAFLAFVSLGCLAGRRWVPAAAAASAALLVKNNGVVAVGFCLATYGLAWMSGGLSRRRALTAALIMAAAFPVNFALQKAKQHDPKRLEMMPRMLKAQDTAARLFFPDPIAFLTEPFVDPWEKTPNREHAPNYFWKTSLVGEWRYEFPGAEALARALAAALAGLLLLAAVSFLRDPQAGLLPALALLGSFAAVLGFRIWYQFANNADFRYVYPFAAFGVAALLARAPGRLGTASMAGTAAFLLLSETFFVLLWVSDL